MKALQFTRVHVFGSPVILTEGGHVDDFGKIVGVFGSEEAARSDDPDSAAIATLAWSGLTAEQQAMARENSEALAD